MDVKRVFYLILFIVRDNYSGQSEQWYYEYLRTNHIELILGLCKFMVQEKALRNLLTHTLEGPFSYIDLEDWIISQKFMRFLYESFRD